MPRGGHREGAGRPRGALGKGTIERAIIAEQVVERAQMTGEKLAKEYLNDFLKLFAGMAAYYQPTLPGMAQQNQNGDEGKFERWADKAMYAAKELAKYQSPQYRAIAVTTQPGIGMPGDGARAVGGNVIDISDQTAVARTYREIMQAPIPRRVAATPAAKKGA